MLLLGRRVRAWLLLHLAVVLQPWMAFRGGGGARGSR
eukprot:SAG31_NODE_25132_length_467_cov_0.983696_1_plen_36_part_01